MTWQLIERAPKDGTLILLYSPRGEYAPLARKADYFVGWWGYNKWATDPHDDFFGEPDSITPDPTHWMPLPEPPK